MSLILLPILSACEDSGQEDGKAVWNDEWRFCTRQEYEEVDTQCAAAKGICQWKSVNYKYMVEVQEYYKKQGKRVDCPAIPKHLLPSLRPECVKGMCTFKDDDAKGY